MASTTRDDGFHEIQLNGKQLVFLFMAATVVTVVIFLCGVLVGRGVRLDRGGVVQAAGAVEAPEHAEDVPPPIPSDPGSSNQPIAGEAGLKYPDALEGNAPPAEKLVAEAPGTRGEPVAETTTAAPAAAAPAPAVAAAAPGGSGLEIQVSAFRERGDAEVMAKRLAGKGYPAYIVEPTGSPVLYRVRVGKFGEQREADRVASRLKKEEKLDPWIVR